VQLREIEARAVRRDSAVKIAALGSAAFAFVQSTGGDVLGNAPEPVWMVAWGVALLFLASGARSLLVQQASASAPAAERAARVTPGAQDIGVVGQNVELMLQSRG
jgi:hypothetical protein